MEYRNLQDNISPETYNDRISGIANWINENRDKYEWAKDPNAYEMTNIFLLGSKYAGEGYKVDLDTLKNIWNTRKQDFEHAGVSEDSFIYKICEDSFNAAISKRSLVNDESSHHALRKMTGIGLYLAQQRQKGEVPNFNNPQELLELIEASRTLKGIHTDLFQKYHFMANLKTICKLQPENALSDRINNALNKLQEEKGDLEKTTEPKQPEEQSI